MFDEKAYNRDYCHRHLEERKAAARARYARLKAEGRPEKTQIVRGLSRALRAWTEEQKRRPIDELQC